ncbi:hypothetical protein CCOS865_01438 [Pseudomonas reidholzensis]|uniref:Lipoprotein n=1 Tax=Pseudomonas reidholzensis TaxID=1785162 RepID=A0A383RS57_9PSED|nr:hypothetical protein [Pseudomonas reidholzensis]SYX89198.1 hypothetical protein CCOS865_01438 [Pseudomonas reidholzensis]
MKKISLCLGAALLTSLVGCAANETLDTSRLTKVDENHASIEANGARYTLDSYIIPFNQPYFISVQRDDGKPLTVAEAAAVAQPYIEPRGCTQPVARRPDLDKSNGSKTQWIVGIEC